MAPTRDQTHPGAPRDLKRRLIVVQDALSPCPYIDGQAARMPLHYSLAEMDGLDVDRLLETGYRRSGEFVYVTRCPHCQECLPTRLPVDRFKYTRGFKRVYNRAQRELTWTWAEPVVNNDRVAMYNRHRAARDLSHGGGPIVADDYRAFLIDSCFPSLELSVYRDGQLVAVSIMDVGARAVSAVYTHFDPDASRFSLGTLAVLLMQRWAAEQKRDWLYLGLFVEQNRHLNYKSRFRPQQRRIHERWVDIAAE
ncbi:MAG: arginyltransferase [Planctomycetota bacterium]